jgi:putative transposase
MPQYRRLYIHGGTYFFTVVSYQRRPILVHPMLRRALSESIQFVKKQHPFDVHAWVLLPDHMHCVWRLPRNESDYSKRWAQIKRLTSQHVAKVFHDEERANPSMRRRRELTIWQPRFWEHWIRNDDDLRQTIQYIHRNPVKHGLVNRIEDWPFSTYHRFK